MRTPALSPEAARNGAASILIGRMVNLQTRFAAPLRSGADLRGGAGSTRHGHRPAPPGYRSARVLNSAACSPMKLRISSPMSSSRSHCSR